jgi:CRP/FNR family cyclic AMP-dependent transcriptional regulator
MGIKDELAKVDVMKGLSSTQLERIAQICEEKNYKAGEAIHTESGKAEELYVLSKGEVELQVQLSTHNERVTVGIINRSNQCFGWSGVIAPHYYTAAAVCKVDSEILVINGKKLLEILENEPEAGFKVMKGIAMIISSRLRNCRSALLKTL